MGPNKHEIGRVSKWPLYIWFLFVVLFPFYVFGSGMPQPSDWLLALLILYGIVNYWKLQVNTFKIIRDDLFYFVFYVIIVNTLWSLFIDQSLEKRFPSYFHSLFYIFNFFVFRLALILYQRYESNFLKVTAYGVGTSMLIQSLFAISTGAITSRSALYFNNPNQLGYYALLAGSILILISSKVSIHVLFQVASYIAFLLLCLISSSKAALAGSLILIGLALINQGLLNIRQLAVLMITLLSGYFFISGEMGGKLLNYSINRFETIGQSHDDSVEGRGYDRILNDPEYMILGAGEGGYYRFDTLLDAGEIHSSFGTIIFCYGIVGTFLFLRFLTKIFKGGSLFNFLYAIPVFVYSITHQGLRSTLFWFFLAVIYLLNVQYRFTSKQKGKNKAGSNNYRSRIFRPAIEGSVKSL